MSDDTEGGRCVAKFVVAIVVACVLQGCMSMMDPAYSADDHGIGRIKKLFRGEDNE